MISMILLAAVLVMTGLDDAQLAWTKMPDGPELFEQGKKLFQNKNYGEAEDALQKARKLAKGRATKQEVDRWQRAARGGRYLAELRKAADGGNSKAVYASAEKFYREIVDTPIKDAFDALINAIRKDIFFDLENFDRPSKRYSKKHGKEFVDDPKYVKQGTHALKWETISHPAELKVKEVPRDLTPYRAVSFWLKFDGVGSDYTVLFKGAGKAKIDSGEHAGLLTSNVFVANRKPHNGWKRIEIDLTQFKSYGRVEWSSIQDFRIQFPSKKKTTLYIDDIALVKK